jgi:hypothetical protein
LNPRPTDYEADQNTHSDADLRRNPSQRWPEGFSIEDICLIGALSCPSKPAKMAHRWPRDFADDERRARVTRGGANVVPDCRRLAAAVSAPNRDSR